MSIPSIVFADYFAPDALVKAIPVLVASPIHAMKWAAILAFAPQVAKVAIMTLARKPAKGKNRGDSYIGGFDNNGQRPQLARLAAENPYGIITTLQAAHSNSLETLIFFYAGALAAHFGAPGKRAEANGIASLFLVLRACFCLLYVVQGTSGPLGGLRSCAWAASLACSMRLLSLAM